jgi:hypothetical protein
MTGVTRRIFLCLSGMGMPSALWACRTRDEGARPDGPATRGNRMNIGVRADGTSLVCVARNGTPEGNMRKVLEMSGGIDRFIGPRDIVLLKPNAQWWNQGTTNTDAMRAFIDAVLAMRDFRGEIIVAENHHFPEVNSRGWTTEQRNGAYNLNELVRHFQRNGVRNVTKVHWRDGGPSRPGYWGGAENGGIVTGPGRGDGYVWRSDLVYVAPSGRKAMMSYPVFTSPYSGITVDFKEGPCKDGAYLKDRSLRFVNFYGLNHHGADTGITASIKNYLGICDMTCGHRGTGPEGFHNFHFVGYSNRPGVIKAIGKKFGWREMTGDGRWLMRSEYVTAEYVDTDRTDLGGRAPSSSTRWRLHRRKGCRWRRESGGARYAPMNDHGATLDSWKSGIGNLYSDKIEKREFVFPGPRPPA